MRRPLVGILVGANLLVLGACSEQRDFQPAAPVSETRQAVVPWSTASVTVEPATTSVTTPTTTTGPKQTTTTGPKQTTTTGPKPTTTTGPKQTTTTRPKPTTTTRPKPTTTTTDPPRPKPRPKPKPTPTTTTAPPTTTTAPPVLPGVQNPECVVQINSGDSLSRIADAITDEAVSVESLQAENGIANPDSITAGDYLDICVNEVDDITGEKRVSPATTPPASSGGSGVAAQQQKLNELFAGYGLPALTVDGDSGRYTEQQLCAARLALNLSVSRADMAPGSAEEQALMSAGALSIPSTAPVSSNRWVLIDQTCQIMFVGEGSSRIEFVFPASTGEAGHETRDQNGSSVFRYDPARDNGGWHDSTAYPVPADNPLNGNMYKPLYFDDGQAIHGAGNVPPEPASKGCVRLHVESQDALVNWLGLHDVTDPLWDPGDIGLTVSVQGHY